MREIQITDWKVLNFIVITANVNNTESICIKILAFKLFDFGFYFPFSLIALFYFFCFCFVHLDIFNPVLRWVWRGWTWFLTFSFLFFKAMTSGFIHSQNKLSKFYISVLFCVYTFTFLKTIVKYNFYFIA